MDWFLYNKDLRHERVNMFLKLITHTTSTKPSSQVELLVDTGLNLIPKFIKADETGPFREHHYL